ncbi:MAG: response regulator [Halobacteriovoraceae bacterium]|nr:response regulator [Halobacteriovoraceae bacterium]
MANNFNLDYELEELRKEFFENLFYEMDNVEDNLYILEESESPSKIVSEIFRVAHSLKGGSGSLELSELTTLFHHFEDFLSNSFKSVNVDEFKNVGLEYVELIKKCANDFLDGQVEDIDKYIVGASTLKTEVEKDKMRVLFVESTKIVSKLEIGVANDLNLSYSVVKDGLQALNKLYSDSFDILVTNNILRKLDGPSLITALKVSNSLNSQIKTILVSSIEDFAKDSSLETRADFFVVQDENFQQNLKNIFEKELESNSIKNKNIQNSELNILYVEDDIILQKFFKMTFKKFPGVKVQIASNKKETIQYLEENKPSIILLDNFLKEEKGEDILRELSANEKWKGIKVIYLTVSPGLVNLSELQDIGNVVEIIGKPFNPKSLLEKIKNYLS